MFNHRQFFLCNRCNSCYPIITSLQRYFLHIPKKHKSINENQLIALKHSTDLCFYWPGTNIACTIIQIMALTFHILRDTFLEDNKRFSCYQKYIIRQFDIYNYQLQHGDMFTRPIGHLVTLCSITLQIKGWDPGINSSQSKMFGKFNFQRSYQI